MFTTVDQSCHHPHTARRVMASNLTVATGIMLAIAVAAGVACADEAAFLAGKTKDCPNCMLERAPLKRKDLTGADLSGAHMAGAVMHRAKLLRVKFTAADLTYANLNKTDLKGAS